MCPVFIHSKICIIDETLARVGSANLTNRSLGLDTECDLAIESSGNPRIEAAIAHFRNRLLGEHLGVSAERVEEAVAARGSLLAAVDALQESERGFACVEARRLHEAESLIPESAIFDPDGPIDPTDLITRALPTEAIQQSHWPVVRLAIVLGLLLLLGGCGAGHRCTPGSRRLILLRGPTRSQPGHWRHSWWVPVSPSGAS
jgi:hypothetical protein